MYFSGTIKNENHFMACFQVPLGKKKNPTSMQCSLRSYMIWSHLSLCPTSVTTFISSASCSLSSHTGCCLFLHHFRFPAAPGPLHCPQGTLRAPISISNFKSQILSQRALPFHTNIAIPLITVTPFECSFSVRLLFDLLTCL